MKKPEIDPIFALGEENPFGQYFIGQSYLKMLCTEGVGIGNVTFEPGCRNNWHIHRAQKGGGQILLCTAVVKIPAGVKHWHGAAKDSWFAHLSVEVPGEETSNEWLEPVDDQSYNAL